MIWLRIANLAVWGLLLLYMVPGAWSAARNKRSRHGDPMRLAVFITCVVMISGTLRWLVAPDNQVWLGIVHAMAIADALIIADRARAYGRGPRV